MQLNTPGEVFNPIPDSRLVYRTVTFSLAANETLPVQIQYQIVKVIACSDDTAIKGRIGYGTDVVDLSVGLGYGVNAREQDEGKFYNSIELQNRSASPNTIKLAFAFGNITDDRITIGGSITAKEQLAATFNTGQVSVGNGAAVQIETPNSSRKALTIFAGAADLWVKENNTVTTANGHRILAGSSITFTHADSVWGIRAVAATNCTFAEETY